MYTPTTVPRTPAELPGFLEREFIYLAQAMQSVVPYVLLDTLHVAPTKLREGMVAKADGTDWDPGSGSGVYVYRGAAWHLLG